MASRSAGRLDDFPDGPNPLFQFRRATRFWFCFQRRFMRRCGTSEGEFVRHLGLADSSMRGLPSDGTTCLIAAD